MLIILNVIMLSNNLKSYINSLKQKKFRQKYQKFIIEGDKMVYELMNEAPDLIQYIVYKENIDINNFSKRIEKSKLLPCKPADFDQISSLQSPQNLLAVCSIPDNDEIVYFNWAFYLDGIQDPGNLGTILRICDWFGLNTLLISSDTVDPFNPKVVQASMGSIWRINIKVVNLENVISQYENHPIFGADMNGSDIKSLDLPEKGIMVLGNEGNGIRAETKLLIKNYIKIPKHKQSLSESLNVAISAGIIASNLS